MRLYERSRSNMLAMVLTLVLTPLAVQGQGVVINEFMAQNVHTLADDAGEYDDWVELYNPTSRLIDLAGLYLTDDLDNPRLWQIPTGRPSLTTVASGGYVLIWADKGTTGSRLHAGLELGSGGDTIALFDKDGVTLIDSIKFPGQRPDVSYGRDPDGGSQWRYFTMATPGSHNMGAFLGEVSPLVLSHRRGFYEGPFSLSMTCETPESRIVYTLDGSVPCDLAGHFSTTAKVYDSPIPISTTTYLRVVAYKPGWLPTPAETHTYLFLDDVIGFRQSAALAAGYPSTWYGSYPADYEMDPDIVTVAPYGDLVIPAMQAIPTLSLVTPKDNLFSKTNDAKTGGIYIYTGHSSTGGRGWERPISAEFFTVDGSREFQIDCGLVIQGGESRNPPKNPKHSFGLRFRGEYGQTHLDYDLFGGSAVKSFDAIHLRGVFNNAWAHWAPDQRQRADYIRDQWARDALTAMGQQDAGQGFFVHLYLDGIYWGLYNIEERIGTSHHAAYNGGDKDRLDAVNGGTVTQGTTAAWNELKTVVAARNWEQIQKVLNIDNYIDWSLLSLFDGNQDIKVDGNWRAAGGGPDRRPWRFYSWDGEHVLESVSQRGISPASDPSGLFTSLSQIEEFRIRFGDRVHRHLFNGGALVSQRNADRWSGRAAEINLAVIGESARWGDFRRDVHQYQNGPYYLYTRDDFWTPEINRVTTTYFPARNDIALQQFKDMNLYPKIGAPVFNVNGTYQHGGHVKSTDRLTVTLPQGTTGKIYYSLDGTDPRVPSVGSTPSAPEITLVAGSAAKRVFVPTAAISDAWKGGAVFDDSGWTAVTASPGGVGFDTNPTAGGDYRPYVSCDLSGSMLSKNGSCYIRIPFTVDAAEVGTFGSLTLKILYDDGFVAYLNGVELYRATFTGTPAWNSMASTSHAGLTLTTFDASGLLGEIRAGSNILAIQGMNSSKASDDLLILADLVTTKAASPGATNLPPGVLEYKGALTLSRSATVKARCQSGTSWSALNEAVYGVGPVASGLRVSEIMYHPADPNTEFIEATNVAPEAINLSLVRFAKGIDFTFGGVVLPPGGAVVVVKDRDAFAARYGQGPMVAGVYTGSLDNAGERIRLEDAAGTLIADFEYKDGWYKTTDGQGYSLVVKTPETADPGALSDKASWRASSAIGGSPGLAE